MLHKHMLWQNETVENMVFRFHSKKNDSNPRGLNVNQVGSQSCGVSQTPVTETSRSWTKLKKPTTRRIFDKTRLWKKLELSGKIYSGLPIWHMQHLRSWKTHVSSNSTSSVNDFSFSCFSSESIRAAPYFSMTKSGKMRKSVEPSVLGSSAAREKQCRVTMEFPILP